MRSTRALPECSPSPAPSTLPTPRSLLQPLLGFPCLCFTSTPVILLKHESDQAYLLFKTNWWSQDKIYVVTVTYQAVYVLTFAQAYFLTLFPNILCSALPYFSLNSSCSFHSMFFAQEPRTFYLLFVAFA